MTARPWLSMTCRIGKRTCTLTVQAEPLVGPIVPAMEWRPTTPRRLNKREKREWYRATTALTEEIAAQLGQSIRSYWV